MKEEIDFIEELTIEELISLNGGGAIYDFAFKLGRLCKQAMGVDDSARIDYLSR